ncbi:hypothetical protein B6U91_02265 [Candidatus Pacearchaeota archaeon ex4484_71]|nr:MAG: hypothetical protein B6U91_02265 [Candidatus Pacearchaeota archaeon ex4484_71]
MKSGKSIEKLLNPKKIIIIEVSENATKSGLIISHKLEKFKGKKIFVKIQKNKRNITPLKKSLENNIDLAIIISSLKKIPKILRKCSDNKIQNYLLLPPEPNEKEDLRLMKKILRISDRKKLNILGPDSLGIFNQKQKLDLTQSTKTPKKGNIAFISQSGTLWSYVGDLGVGINYYVGLGKNLGTGFAEFIEYFNEEKSVKKIVCYIEKLRESKKFIEACKKSKKEIIVLKGGKTSEGMRISNNSISKPTEYKRYEGIFKQAGAKISPSIAKTFRLKKQDIRKKLKKDEGIIITNSKGAATLLTDELNSKKFNIRRVIFLGRNATPLKYRETLDKFNNYRGDIIIIAANQATLDAEALSYLLPTHPTKDKIKVIFLGKSMEKYEKIFKKNKVPFFTTPL